MKIEDRLRRELSDTAEHLALDQDTYEQVLDLGRRRRRIRQIAAATGTTALVAVVAGVLTLGPGAPNPVIAASTTTAALDPTTTVTLAPSPATQGVLVASPNGIVVSGFDGTSSQLTSDTYYEAIAWVISDGAGGIVFQHEVTPLPWAQGTILHLVAGQSKPTELVVPEPGTYIRPLDTEVGLVLYRVDAGGTSEIRSIDLATKDIQLVVPASEFLVNAAAEASVVVAAFGGDCPRLEVFSLDGTAVDSSAWDTKECRVGFITDLAISGGYLYTIEDTDGRHLVRVEFESGATVSAPIGEGHPIVDGWSLSALPDGTVAVGGSEILVGSFEGDAFVDTARFEAGSTFVLAGVDGFPGDATLGSGSTELPCTPIDVPPVGPQGLPQPVEDKRLLIFEMAANCELESLSEMAVADGTAFTFGGETDPLRSWIRSARSGFDVMTWIVRLFNATPALDEIGTYAWPAVHATNSEEGWQELSGILSAAEYDQYNRSRDSGWLGLRIGIAPDGTWTYVIAGD
jgi:hypothetical protein